MCLFSLVCRSLRPFCTCRDRTYERSCLRTQSPAPSRHRWESCSVFLASHCHDMKREMPDLPADGRELGGGNDQSDTRHSTSDFMSRQTASGSRKHKCQVFPHESSRDCDPGDTQGPWFFFFLSAFRPFGIAHSLRRPSFLPLSARSSPHSGTQELFTRVSFAEDNGRRAFCDVMIPAIFLRSAAEGRRAEGNGPNANTHKEPGL